ncbi:MAG: sulfur carrier protein ThiS [Clostridia bacterium]|nr:sulfur carrier protein ThiS [Clostridia bacterium]
MKVNGEEKNLTSPVSLKEYLLSEQYNLNHIAVELDDEIIKKSDYDKVMLNNQSQLEIVHFLGGG